MLFRQNLLRMVVQINFCLFPLTPYIACSFIYCTISVKNQARLARKIIGSYSRVFTVMEWSRSTNFDRIQDCAWPESSCMCLGHKISKCWESLIFPVFSCVLEQVLDVTLSDTIGFLCKYNCKWASGEMQFFKCFIPPFYTKLQQRSF